MKNNFAEIYELIYKLQDKLNDTLTQATDEDWEEYKTELTEVEDFSICLQYYKKNFEYYC